MKNQPFEEVRHAVEVQTKCPLTAEALDALYVAWAGSPAREARIFAGWAEHGPVVLALVRQFPWSAPGGKVPAAEMVRFYIFARDRSRDLRLRQMKAAMGSGYAALEAGDIQAAERHFRRAETIQSEPTPLC